MTEHFLGSWGIYVFCWSGRFYGRGRGDLYAFGLGIEIPAAIWYHHNHRSCEAQIDITDKSKADMLAKFLVCAQALWMTELSLPQDYKSFYNLD